MNADKYIVDKSKVKNSKEFKKYIYIKYAIYDICIISVILLFMLLNVNIKYIKAVKLYNNKEYKTSYEILKKHPNYRKSGEYLRNITYKLIPSLEIGDEVFLGSYNNKVIKWTVLSIEDDNILLMSKGHISSKDKYEDWDYSNLRFLLNNNFYYTAFNNKEKNIIIPSLVNESYKNTIDKIFILDKEEAKKYKIYDYDENVKLIYRDEHHYYEERFIVYPTMWISIENQYLNEIEDLKLYYEVDLSEVEEKNIIKTKIGMYDYLLKEDDKTCYYWKGLKENYYACVKGEEERIVIKNNIDEDAVEDIINRRRITYEK